MDKDIVKKLKVLKELLAKHDLHCWKIGDVVAYLMDKKHLSLGDISIYVNYSRARLSHFHLTARTFPMPLRKGYSFQDSFTARKIHLSIPRLKMTPVQIRDIIAGLEDKSFRKVHSYFIRKLIEQEQNENIMETLRKTTSSSIINRCYYAKWQDVITQIPSNEIKIFICDPPYSIYNKKYDGKYRCARPENSSKRANCSNDNTKAALSDTLELFDYCLPKLTPDGVLILFQAGGKPDRPEIQLKARETGWQCQQVLTWVKSRYGMGSKENPYRTCTERILIFGREGISLKKHQNGMFSTDLIDIPTETRYVSQKMAREKIDFYDYHVYQKPEALLTFLIRQHSYPGDIVFENYGCSGSGSIAAIHNDRQWIYVESNEENYTWGEKRIHDALEIYHSQVG